MVDASAVDERDILEVLFYSTQTNDDIRVAIDVTGTFEKYSNQIIAGTVVEVKNMPFEALVEETPQLYIDDNKVFRGDFISPTNDVPIGTNIRLISV